MLNNWVMELVQCRATCEAWLDFAEDNNIEDNLIEQTAATVRRLSLNLKEHLSNKHRGELIRDGVRVTILGPPNAGKSSLLNLLGTKRALF